MLKLGRDESRKQGDDDHHLVACASPSDRHPHRQTERDIAEHGKEEQLHRRPARLTIAHGPRVHIADVQTHLLLAAARTVRHSEVETASARVGRTQLKIAVLVNIDDLSLSKEIIAPILSGTGSCKE